MSDRYLLLRLAGDLLRRPGAERALDNEGIGTIHREASRLAGAPVAESSSLARVRFADRLAEAGLLVRVQRDLYANLAAVPVVHPNEIACRLRDGARVGLHTVLGELGISHNPSRVVTAIIPASSRSIGAPRRQSTPFGDYRFLAMRDDAFLAGEAEDREDTSSRYPRATPERAFCDWIYLSSQKGRGNLEGPPLDVDVDGLDMERLTRLGVAMGVSEQLERWLERRAEAAKDDESEEKYSRSLGF